MMTFERTLHRRVAIVLSMLGLIALSFAAGLSDAAETPQELPPTPIDPNLVTNQFYASAELHVTDPVKLEAAALKVLTNKLTYALTSTAAKKLLRPLGELDQQLCIDYVLLARIGVATDGFAALGGTISRGPVHTEMLAPELPPATGSQP